MKICKMCGDGIETLEHFILTCVALQGIRNRRVELQMPRAEQYLDQMGCILLLHTDHNDNDMEEKIQLIYDMWISRSLLIREVEQNNSL